MDELAITLSIGFDAQSIVEFVENNANLLFVFLLMAVESSFIPFPSEAVVPPAVYFMLHKAGGGFDLGIVVLIILAATAGALVGALVNYYLSMWLGRPIVYRFANSRLGHFFLLSQEKVEQSEAYFDKHGSKATLIGRLIPAIRQLISIPAGLAKMHLGKFCLFTSLGACIWNCILAALGAWMASAVSREELFNTLEKYNGYFTIGGLILLAACIIYMCYKAFSRKKETSK